MPDTGILYGVGVGPGDPELLTIKAVRILQSVDVVYAAASSKNSYSTACDIARPHMRPDTQVMTLPFPMTRDKEALLTAWQENARTVLADIALKRQVAFLTLGDPMTYSTFGYLLRTIQKLSPEVSIKVIPGITSYCAAAAASQTILAEGEETLSIVSGARGGRAVKQVVHKADSLVVLKAYKQFADLKGTLNELGLMDNAVLVSNCGKDTECIERDVSMHSTTPPYFSLLLTRHPRNSHSPSLVCEKS